MTINITKDIHECEGLKYLGARSRNITRIETYGEYAILEIDKTTFIPVKYCPGCGKRV